MANNSSKLWIQRRINEAAIIRAKEAIFATGWGLPCKVVAVNGSIVTVAFEVDSSPWVLPQITIPKAESNWIRYPTQVGDTGMTIPADCHLGGISGLGSGVPKINVRPANLSGLVFMPVSRKDFPPQDPNAVINQGPNGVVSQTTSGTPSSVITNVNGTTITYGSNTILINATGVTITSDNVTIDATTLVNITAPTTNIMGALAVSGAVTAGSLAAPTMTVNGVDVGTHYHGGVTTGSGDTGTMI